jgi:hypothetical protein
VRRGVKLNLLDVGVKGSSFYNVYHVLSQLSSMYSTISHMNHKKLKQLEEFADPLLVDIGTMVKIWNDFNGGLTHYRQIDDPILGAQIVRHCYRGVKIVTLMNMWTPAPKALSLLLLFEKRWQMFLDTMIERNRVPVGELEELRANASVRIAKVDKLLGNLRFSYARTDRQYLAPKRAS